MNDKQIIQSAVELADGFEWDIERDVLVSTQYGQLNMVHDEPMMLDHLAAQLVRQVDALGKKRNGMCDVLIWQMKHEGECMDWPPDRTMNTLRAIVESGVLK